MFNLKWLQKASFSNKCEISLTTSIQTVKKTNTNMEFHSIREKKTTHSFRAIGKVNLRRHSTNKICPARPIKHVVLAMDQKNAKHAKNYHTRLTRDVRKFANYIYQKWYTNPINCKNYFQNYPLFDFLRNIEQDFFFVAPLLRSWRWWQFWKWRRLVHPIFMKRDN